jgi:hypothetical protein
VFDQFNVKIGHDEADHVSSLTTQMTGGRYAKVDEREANAHLVSAAPDLYEALNLVMQWWRHGDEGDMPISIEVACDKAILKAEGREV